MASSVFEAFTPLHTTLTSALFLAVGVAAVFVVFVGAAIFLTTRPRSAQSIQPWPLAKDSES